MDGHASHSHYDERPQIARILPWYNPHPPLFEPTQPVDVGVSKNYPMVGLSHRRMKPVREPIVERVIVKQATVEKPVLVEKPVVQIKEVPKVVEKVVEKAVEVERIIFSNVAFRFNSAELIELGKGTVCLAADRLKENKNVVIGIEGHADYMGMRNTTCNSLSVGPRP